MSEDTKTATEERAKVREKSVKTIQRALRKIEAFGYVDINWIASAFSADYIENYKPPQGVEPPKPKGLKGFLQRFGLFKDKPIQSTDRRRLYKRPKDMREEDWDFLVSSVRRLRRVLAGVPLPPTLRELETQAGKKRPAAKAGSRKLSEKEEAQDVAQLRLIAKFMRKSGLEETGFPIRLIGDTGDGGPTLVGDHEKADTPSAAPAVSGPARPQADQPGGVTLKPGDAPKPEERNKALSLLTGGLLYRFAYDQDKALNWDDTEKVFRANGVYRIYVIPPDTGLVERRLLLVKLDKHSTIVRVAELRKRRKKIVARGGYLIPAAGVNTLILSSDFSAEALGEMIKDQLPNLDPQEVFPDNQDDEPGSSASFLQEHQLAFYSLVNRGEREFRGSIMEGPAPASVVGYWIHPKSIETLREPDIDQAQIPFEAEGPFSEVKVQYRPKPAELSILEPGDIEDPRDRMLVSAISQNPSVSIDIG